MENTDLLEQVTALADNEINDQELVNKLKQKIEFEPYLKFEYQVQSSLKKIVKMHLGNVEVPNGLKEQVIKQIIYENIPKFKYRTQKAPWWYFIFKPQYAVGFTIVALAAIYLVFFTSNNLDKLVNQQNGKNNMFVQASQNFSKIMKGQLPVQIFSNDPNTIKNYFRKEGVQYQTAVPKIEDHELVGATISESKGEKFAHHIYKSKDGKLIYFYQANEKCIKKDNCLDLSKDLMNMIDKGKYFTYKKGDKSFLVWKHEKNICIIVSNEDNLEKLESEFISNKW